MKRIKLLQKSNRSTKNGSIIFFGVNEWGLTDQGFFHCEQVGLNRGIFQILLIFYEINVPSL